MSPRYGRATTTQATSVSVQYQSFTQSWLKLNETIWLDTEFTHEAPKLTPVDRLFLMNLDQSEFEGFTFLNPEYGSTAIKE